jgi:hypothetical protein
LIIAFYGIKLVFFVAVDCEAADLRFVGWFLLVFWRGLESMGRGFGSKEKFQGSWDFVQGKLLELWDL